MTDLDQNWASKPGNTIKDFLNEKNISLAQFQDGTNLNQGEVNALLEGKIIINIKIAQQLEQFIGATTNFWIDRDLKYRASLKLIENRNQKWLKSIPWEDMVKLGWIEKSNNILDQCLNFFEVGSVVEWENKYKIEISQLLFKTSKKYESDIASISTWVRRGEKITQNIECNDWNKDLFIKKLYSIKKLTRIKSPKDFIPKLISICSECGVALAISRTPKGCKASGVTKFINGQKALIILSFRYLSDDQFWFTFFHEAGHLILHDKDNLHVELDSRIKATESEKEREANLFASEFLIPYTKRTELKSLKSNKRKIVKYAMDLGISPGIVVGQMQFHGLIRYEYLNGYKRRYNWDDIESVYY